jgi:putative ABC transport system permease protein
MVIGFKSANAYAVDSIIMQAKSGNQIQAAQDAAKALLRQRHHLLVSLQHRFATRDRKPYLLNLESPGCYTLRTGIWDLQVIV